MQVGYRQKSRFWSNSWLSKVAGRAMRQKQLPTTMQCRSRSWRLRSKCLFVMACSMDEYAKEKRTEKNLIVHSGISEAETTNNKRLRLTFCIEATQTRCIVRPLCDSRASCLRHRRGFHWRKCRRIASNPCMANESLGNSHWNVP